MLVQKASDFKRTETPRDWPERCRVPVEILVLLAPRVEIALSTAGLMPSVLPNKWDDCAE